MANTSLTLTIKEYGQGERKILVRFNIDRTIRPQFKTDIAIDPKYFVDGAIKIPARGKLNAELRHSLLMKQNALDTFIATITAIAAVLPKDRLNRKDIFSVYEDVKDMNPADIKMSTIIAKRKENVAKELEVAKIIEEKVQSSVIDYCYARVQAMKDGSLKRKGNNYTDQTIRTYEGLCRLLTRYIKAGNTLEWSDIDERKIDHIIQFFADEDLMKKTINKNLAVLCAMLNCALRDNYKFNASVLNQFPKLKITKDDKAVEIYLTEVELQALYEMELTGLDDVARDVFLAGCYTSQRYSDYSCISKRNVSFHDGIGVITLVQQKTGTEVSIPVLNDNLLEILKKYDYTLPKIKNCTLNERIKKILKRLSATVPSLAEEIETLTTKQKREFEKRNGQKYNRGKNGLALVPRYEMVVTHTARRTGITLMYLSGLLDTHEMMSISGHKTEEVFHEYIKVSGVELATNIAKKIMNAKQEANMKAILLREIEKMSAKEIAQMLETAKTKETK